RMAQQRTIAAGAKKGHVARGRAAVSDAQRPSRCVLGAVAMARLELVEAAPMGRTVCTRSTRSRVEQPEPTPRQCDSRASVGGRTPNLVADRSAPNPILRNASMVHQRLGAAGGASVVVRADCRLTVYELSGVTPGPVGMTDEDQYPAPATRSAV